MAFIPHASVWVFRHKSITEEYEEQIEESSFVDFMDHIKTQKYLESIKRTADYIKQADSFYTLGLGGHEAYAKHTIIFSYRLSLFWDYR